eukprot:TRINITY_DN4753_c0_g4_i2.p1 TRINITY_DN4753_c0_g4~~TRINITY_DN4753_c0_g4_i2.p1  ORF type:complete len:1181 (-),score=268.49 TRINITY_DN4753_c0_g4_i2:134-3676(-)
MCIRDRGKAGRALANQTMIERPNESFTRNQPQRMIPRYNGNKGNLSVDYTSFDFGNPKADARVKFLATAYRGVMQPSHSKRESGTKDSSVDRTLDYSYVINGHDPRNASRFLGLETSQMDYETQTHSPWREQRQQRSVSNAHHTGGTRDSRGHTNILHKRSPSEAPKPIQRKPKLSPTTVQALNDAKKLIQERSYTQAVSILEAVLDKQERSLEARYLMGLCYLNSSQYANAIEQFQKMIELDENREHRNVNLLIAVAYKKKDDVLSALSVLSNTIAGYPNFYDAYIYRGKLYLKARKVDKALNDFTNAIKVDPKRASAYLGKGDCLRLLKKWDESLQQYNLALENRDATTEEEAKLKRAIAKIELGFYSEALPDLEEVIGKNPQNCDAMYFKGYSLLKQGKESEAILCFEQTLRLNNSKKAVTKAIYEMVKMKINSRDFYSAYWILNRTECLNVDMNALHKYKLFIEGVIFLMKKKFKEGYDNLNTLTSKNQVGEYLKDKIHVYKSYASFCLGNHEEAIEEMKKAQTYGKLEKGAQYNKLLCEGILSLKRDGFDFAAAQFSKANTILPNKMEPFFYRAVTILMSMNRSLHKLSIEEQSACIVEALRELDIALQLNDSSAPLFFFRGLLSLVACLYDQAISDLEKAIEKSDDNIPKYYYTRGLAYAARNNIKEAITDFTIATNLDAKFVEAYLERARVNLLRGDEVSAYSDIQKFVSLSPEDEKTFVSAGNLLFCATIYDEACKMYSRVPDLAMNIEILYLRVRTYIKMKELNAALEDLNRVIELGGTHQREASADRDMLHSLKIASVSKSDFHKNLRDAEEKITKVINSKKFGLIFDIHDCYFYRAVMRIYSQEYIEAMSDLIKANEYREKFLEGRLAELQNEVVRDGQLDEPSFDHEMAELEENTSFNRFEYLYTYTLLLILTGNCDEAIQVLENMAQYAVEKSRENLEILSAILKNEMALVAAGNVEEGEVEEKEIGPLMIFPFQNRLCSIYPPIILNFTHHKNIELKLSFCLPRVENPSIKPNVSIDLLAKVDHTSVENKPEAPWIRRNNKGIIFTEKIIEDVEHDVDDIDAFLKDNNLKESGLIHKLREEIATLENGSKKSIKDKGRVEEAADEFGNHEDYERMLLMHHENPMMMYDIDLAHEDNIISKSKIKDKLKLDDTIEQKLNKLLKKGKA